MPTISVQQKIEQNRIIKQGYPGRYDLQPKQRVKSRLKGATGEIVSVENDGTLILHSYTVRWDDPEMADSVEEPTSMDAIE